MHKVCTLTSHDIWLFYQKLTTVGESNMDPITVGNWARNPQGVLWLIEVGEGV